VPASGQLTFTITVTTVHPGQVQPAGTIAILANGQDVSGPIPLFDDGPTAAGVEVTFRAPTTPRSDTIGAVYHGDANTNGSVSPTFIQTIAGPASTAPAPSQSVPQPASPAGPATTAGALTAMTRPILHALKRRGLAALDGARETLTARGPGTLTQRVYTPVEPKSTAAAKPRSVLIASGRHMFAGLGKGTLTLRLTAAGRRASRRATRIKLAIVTRFAPVGGVPVVAIKRLTIRSRAAARAADRRWTIGRIRAPARAGPK
jgi:hypothetical protein